MAKNILYGPETIRKYAEPTHPSTIVVYPRGKVGADVGSCPVDDVADEEWHLLLNTLSSKGATECQQCHNTTPVDNAVREQTLYRCKKWHLSIVWCDEYLTTCFTECLQQHTENSNYTKTFTYHTLYQHASKDIFFVYGTITAIEKLQHQDIRQGIIFWILQSHSVRKHVPKGTMASIFWSKNSLGSHRGWK